MNHSSAWMMEVTYTKPTLYLGSDSFCPTQNYETNCSHSMTMVHNVVDMPLTFIVIFALCFTRKIRIHIADPNLFATKTVIDFALYAGPRNWENCTIYLDMFKTFWFDKVLNRGSMGKNLSTSQR